MPIRDEDRNIAASAQKHLEKVLHEFLSYHLKKACKRTLCMSGGVSLNSKACGLLNQSLDLDRFFVTPHPSDGGLALGAALHAYTVLENKRPDPICTPYLGVSYDDDEALAQIKCSGLPYKQWESFEQIAELLSKDAVIGVHQGRSEFGPRALGNRSIIASPINKDMRDIINRKIKFREEYRPFAPAVLDKDLAHYFEKGSGDYSYMSFTVQAKPKAKQEAPAVVHIDQTSRIQAVKEELNPFFYKLLQAFKLRTGVPILLNTSFNLKGEPIIETPSDAIRTFVSSGLDFLVLGKYIVEKGRFEKLA
jgi:carbamoyltransferase